MTNTVSAYFIPLYKFIVDNNIYNPKISNQNEGQYYVDLIESNQLSSDLEINYQNFILDYNTKDDLLDINYDFIYYNVYVILYCDFGNSIKTEIYDNIIDKILNGEFVKGDKLNAIRQIILNCGKTPDIIDGWTEGKIISLMLLMIEMNLKEYYNRLVSELANSTLDSYRDIIPFFNNLIGKMYDIKQEKYNKYLINKSYNY
jgi:hypothetical protein